MHGVQVQEEKVPCEVIEILDEETSNSHAQRVDAVRATTVDAPLSGAESSSSSESASSDAESSDNYEGDDEVVAKKPPRSKNGSNSLPPAKRAKKGPGPDAAAAAAPVSTVKQRAGQPNSHKQRSNSTPPCVVGRGVAGKQATQGLVKQEAPTPAALPAKARRASTGAKAAKQAVANAAGLPKLLPAAVPGSVPSGSLVGGSMILNIQEPAETGKGGEEEQGKMQEALQAARCSSAAAAAPPEAVEAQGIPAEVQVAGVGHLALACPPLLDVVNAPSVPVVAASSAADGDSKPLPSSKTGGASKRPLSTGNVPDTGSNSSKAGGKQKDSRPTGPAAASTAAPNNGRPDAKAARELEAGPCKTPAPAPQQVAPRVQRMVPGMRRQGGFKAPAMVRK
ncbi:MAG: hypothetical protein WDW36_002618 [Sanguina aurantia]